MKHDDAELYRIAAEEIAEGTPERGILAKAFAASQGDETKCKPLYIQLRVEQMKEQAKQASRDDFWKWWRSSMSPSFIIDIIFVLFLAACWIGSWPLGILLTVVLLIKFSNRP